ncbi:NaeI family type II restriction endonuclease [Bowmanella denitrificans]|uniref:NaeI family type II restriction endonuclease n=1 Tax=Bowmanella denitrificans TaxID=366582 RepID=UPI000C9CD7D7|nr:NaeI family type II restriction endonuclease [Bowmanella denitrificans]
MDSKKNNNDADLGSVFAWFKSQTHFQSRLIQAIRKAIDEVIDGPRTGRFTYSQLEKTEKTYLGTKVEILLRAEFALDKGEVMDYRVDGIEVDCKYTGNKWAWNIPKEAMGHICLLVRADDEAGTASAGLVRISEEILNPGRNQDKKGTLSKVGRDTILWLVADGQMQINQLHLWSEQVISQIWAKGSGQQRLNELFRLKQGELIDRQTIATVAQAKDDPMKRVRANGGARTYLSKEGIIILGHQNNHPEICKQLELPVPNKGQVIAVRIVRDKSGALSLANSRWRIADSSDPIETAPESY